VRVAPAKPDTSRWTLTEQLLASIIDVLMLANWQRGGGKGNKPPLMTERAPDAVRTQVFSDDQIRQILTSQGPQAKPEA
jgi:hypothetical protein